MPYTDTHPSLPFTGKAPRSRQNSYQAAVSAAETVGTVTDIGDCLGRYGKRVTIWGPK